MKSPPRFNNIFAAVGSEVRREMLRNDKGVSLLGRPVPSLLPLRWTKRKERTFESLLMEKGRETSWGKGVIIRGGILSDLRHTRSRVAVSHL